MKTITEIVIRIFCAFLFLRNRKSNIRNNGTAHHNGWKLVAETKSKCNKERYALVMPQPGHEMPVRYLIGQVIPRRFRTAYNNITANTAVTVFVNFRFFKFMGLLVPFIKTCQYSLQFDKILQYHIKYYHAINQLSRCHS